MPNEGYSIDIDVSGGANTPIVLAASGGTEALEVAVDVGGEISAVQAEKWAVGKARGVDVPSTDITYHNNSKWWSDEARRIFENARVINYVVCDTPGDTAIKAVTVDNWSLEVGMWVCIKFTYTNTKSIPKLNVNNTGAKNIYYNNSIASGKALNEYNVYLIIYDGYDYQIVGMYEIGREPGSSIGDGSLAYGSQVIASGVDAQAFGTQTRATGTASHAMGTQTKASGTDASAEGKFTHAAGDYSHAQGLQNQTYTDYAHVGGKYGVPGGVTNYPAWQPNTLYYIGDGVKVEVSGTYHYYYCKTKHTSGDSFAATNWNEVSDIGEFAEIIGNGTNTNARSNARVLDWNGNERLKGDVYVECNGDSSGGSKLVSEAALGALRGANSGIATLDSSGKVPASQLPSFVDDVVEYANLAAFPGTGEGGKIYVAQDTGKVYRWASNSYVIISDYVHPSYTARTGKPTADATPGFGGTFTVSQVTSDSSGHVSGMTDRTITIPDAVATGSTAGLMSAADKTKLDGIAAGAAAIDDTAGDGDDDVTWSADKLVEEAFCLTTSAISSLPAAITDARITEECVLEDFIPDERIDLGWVTTAGKLVLYGNLPSGTTLPAMKLRVHRIHGLTSDPVSVTLRLQVSASVDGNYLVAEAKNLIPGVQYSWRLYRVVSGGTDVLVSDIGSTPGYPTANRWYQEMVTGLSAGQDYYVTVAPTLDSSNPATSNTVTMVGGENVPEEEIIE